VSFATRKALALLVYLAVERGPHTREKLTALFWPESDPERGRAALRYTLAAVRRALGEPAHVTASRATVGVDAGSDLDLDIAALDEVGGAATVGALAAAAARWQGEFLDGFSLPDAPAFDEWASLQRERWHRRAERVFEQLARAQAEAGARAEAADTAARWVAMSPLNEAAHQQLMQLRLATGDPALVLRVAPALLALEEDAALADEAEMLAANVTRSLPAGPLRQAFADHRSSGSRGWRR
jgi:DNA-binding SARP family transcriptional activator